LPADTPGGVLATLSNASWSLQLASQDGSQLIVFENSSVLQLSAGQYQLQTADASWHCVNVSETVAIVDQKDTRFVVKWNGNVKVSFVDGRDPDLVILASIQILYASSAGVIYQSQAPQAAFQVFNSSINPFSKSANFVLKYDPVNTDYAFGDMTFTLVDGDTNLVVVSLKPNTKVTVTLVDASALNGALANEVEASLQCSGNHALAPALSSDHRLTFASTRLHPLSLNDMCAAVVVDSSRVYKNQTTQQFQISSQFANAQQLGIF